MDLTDTGDDQYHVQQKILEAKITFGQRRSMLRSTKLNRSAKVSIYKGSVLTRATFGCEHISLDSNNSRRYKVFNAKC